MKHKIRYWWKCFAWCYSINHIFWYWFHVVTLLLNYNHMINWSSHHLIPALAEFGGLISVGHVCQYMKFVLDIRVSSSIVWSVRGGDNLEYHFWLQVEGGGQNWSVILIKIGVMNEVRWSLSTRRGEGQSRVGPNMITQYLHRPK